MFFKIALFSVLLLGIQCQTECDISGLCTVSLFAEWWLDYLSHFIFFFIGWCYTRVNWIKYQSVLETMSHEGTMYLVFIQHSILELYTLQDLSRNWRKWPIFIWSKRLPISYFKYILWLWFFFFLNIFPKDISNFLKNKISYT